jgi:hypothetical protein
MAIGIRFTLAGVTAEQYDSVNDRVDPVNNPPEGLLFHASGPVERGWGVIDFWESRAQFDSFFGGHVAPAVQAAGLDMKAPPEVHEFPVHEYFKQ